MVEKFASGYITGFIYCQWYQKLVLAHQVPFREKYNFGVICRYVLLNIHARWLECSYWQGSWFITSTLTKKLQSPPKLTEKVNKHYYIKYYLVHCKDKMNPIQKILFQLSLFLLWIKIIYITSIGMPKCLSLFLSFVFFIYLNIFVKSSYHYIHVNWYFHF